jgi:hypothetical protein
VRHCEKADQVARLQIRAAQPVFRAVQESERPRAYLNPERDRYGSASCDRVVPQLMKN